MLAMFGELFMAANNLLDRYSYPYKDAGVPIICESMDTDKETELRDFSCIVVEKHIGYLSPRAYRDLHSIQGLCGNISRYVA